MSYTEQGTSWAPSFAVCEVVIYCHMSIPACSNFSLLYPQIILMWDFVRNLNVWSQHISPPTYRPVDVTEEINTHRLRKSCLHLKESAWLTTVTCFCTGTKSCRLTPGHSQPSQPRQGDTLPSQTVQSRHCCLWKEGQELHLQCMEPVASEETPPGATSFLLLNCRSEASEKTASVAVHWHEEFHTWIGFFLGLSCTLTLFAHSVPEQ